MNELIEKLNSELDRFSTPQTNWNFKQLDNQIMRALSTNQTMVTHTEIRVITDVLKQSKLNLFGFKIFESKLIILIF